MIDSLVVLIGYLFILGISLTVVSAMYQWALYGEITQSTSQEIIGNKVYLNGRLVAEVDSGSISMVNGNVYLNNKLVYKHTRKFRWEK